MTEESFQQARKVIQTGNNLLGLITKAKGEVAKWTKIEQVHIIELREGQAGGARKCLDKAMIKLNALSDKFAALNFPEPNLVAEIFRCKECGCRIAKGNELCGGCACENDSTF